MMGGAMIEKISVSALLVFTLLVAFASPAHAQISSSQQTLSQYLSDLQKNPNDYALRERIIKHVQAMKPAPGIPEEARRHLVRGSTLIKEAKTQTDFTQGTDEFKQAMNLAPWWPEATYNHALACEAAGNYDGAIKSFRLYQLFSLSEADARAVQDKIYALEVKQEKAVKSPQSVEPAAQRAVNKQEEAQSEFDRLLKKIDGARYTYTAISSNGIRTTLILDIQGTAAVHGSIGNPHEPGYNEISRFEIKDRKTTVPAAGEARRWTVDSTYIISEDGNSITGITRYQDGDRREFIYRRQR
jgi:tetratricopeptide (TPR) repeat protein